MSDPKGTATLLTTQQSTGGGIVRAPRPSSKFTTIRNEVLRDKRLSFRALGILVEILSRPDNWRTRSETLAAGRREGRDAVRTALSELKAAGYLEQHKVRDESGRITTVSIVYDEPREGIPLADAPETDFQASAQPEPGKPAPGKPHVGKPGGIRTTETKNYVRSESAAGASSSSSTDAGTTDDARRGATQTKPKPRTATDRTARIAARKEREREEAVQDICARLGTDLEQAAALCDHLVGEFSPASLARYVESIDNGDLETLLEVATYELDEQREIHRTAADYHGRNIAAFHAGAPKVEVDAVTAMFHDALRAGMVEGEMIQRINGAGVPKSARSIADRYAAALRTPRSVAA